MRTILFVLLLGSASAVGYGQDAKTPDFKQMPHHLGQWEGKDVSIPPEILAAVGADVVVDRIYHDSKNETLLVKSHLAVYWDWKRGTRQDLMKIYKASGWKLLSQAYETIPISEDKKIRVSLSEWEKDQQKTVLLYWYQLGDHILFDRAELDRISSKLSDADKTKPLIKLHLQMTKSHATEDEKEIKDLASQIGKWIDKPYYEKK